MKVFDMSGTGEAKQTDPNVTNLDNGVKPAEQIDTNQNKELQKVITLDGPLSKIMSHALMVVYNKDAEAGKEAATEHVTMAGLMHRVAVKRTELLENEQKQSIYVYAYDNKNVNNHDLLQAIQKLEVDILPSREYDKHMIVVDTHQQADTKLDVVLEFARNVGIPVYLSMEKAINALTP